MTSINRSPERRVVVTEALFQEGKNKDDAVCWYLPFAAWAVWQLCLHLQG